MKFENLGTDYRHFFKHVRIARPRCDHAFFMAIDAEWQQDGERNHVLSYQVATASEESTANLIEYTRQGQRLRLDEIAALGLRSVLGDDFTERLWGKKVKIILACHNTVAEWSVLADRDEPYITKRLMCVRGAPVTGVHPIKTVIEGWLPVYVEIHDTMLLAPAGCGSLGKLSSLLGMKEDQKIDIPQHYKAHMSELLRDDPGLYERYALQDSRITLMLFFVLQDSLNRLVAEVSDGQDL